MPKFLNIHDVLLIGVIVIATHILLKPIYNAIDNATGGTN